MDLKRIGKIIRARRKELGYTQDELGEIVGVTKTTIGNIEKASLAGGGNIEMFAKIASALKLSLDRLFGIQTVNDSSENSMKKIKVITDFIDLFEPKIYIHTETTSNMWTHLTIDDKGVQYVIQEYKRRKELVDSVTNEEDRKEILKIVEADFYKNVADKMIVENGRIVCKDEHLNFVANSLDNCIDLMPRLEAIISDDDYDVILSNLSTERNI